MYTLPELQQYTKCNYNGRNYSGEVVALSNYVGTQQVCFLLENDQMGTWMPIESLFNLKESDTEKNKKITSTTKKTSSTIKPKTKESSKQPITAKADENKPENIEKDTTSEDYIAVKTEEVVVEETETVDKSEIELLLEDIQSHPKIREIKKQASDIAWEKFLDWISSVLMKLDLEAALFTTDRLVKRLKQSYEHSSLRKIANVLIVHKSLQTAGLEVIKVIPKAKEIILGLFDIDLPDITKIAAEMVYQIGLIYGRSKELKERFVDIFVAFGIALLGDKAIDTGIAWLKCNPILATGLTASAKGLMIYAIGHAACVYYEQPETEYSFVKLKEANERYLAGIEDEEDVEELIDVEIETAYTIDYTYLSEYLKQKQWKQADVETGLIIQKMVYRTGETIDYSSISYLPTEDVKKINQLWSTASKKEFGFYSQQQIYKDVDEKLGDFGEKVEWRGEAGYFGGAFGWKSYDNLSFGEDAPKGHLPACWLRIAPGLNGGDKIDKSLKAILERDDWQ